MSDQIEYWALDKQVPFLVASADRITEHDKIAPMTRVYACYNKIIADVAGEMGYREWKKDELDSLRRRMN